MREINSDLTVGKPLKKILIFMLPLLVGNLFQQFYSMVDAVIVGQTLGADALAGVGSTGAFSFLVLGFVGGLTGGFSVLTAQFFGAKNSENVRRSVAASIMLSVVLSIIISIVAVATTNPILRLMRTPDAIYSYAYDYIISIYLGTPAVVFYNLFSGILRAIGDSRSPLYFLIMASFINVGLDFLFIMGFDMGAAGAGWATVASQGISAIACLIYTFVKYPSLRLKAKHFKPNFKFLYQHIRLGLPMALQFSITAVGVMVMQWALNGFDPLNIAAFTAATKIDQMAHQVYMAIGTAMATFTGQNYGAGKYTRIREGTKKMALVSVILSLVLGVLIIALGKPLTMLFVGSGKDELYSLSQIFLWCNASFYVFLVLLLVYRNVLQGMGRAPITVLAGASELIMRIVTAIIAAKYMSYIGVCLSHIGAWIVAMVIVMIVYALVIRKYKTDSPYIGVDIGRINEISQEFTTNDSDGNATNSTTTDMITDIDMTTTTNIDNSGDIDIDINITSDNRQ